MDSSRSAAAAAHRRTQPPSGFPPDPRPPSLLHASRMPAGMLLPRTASLLRPLCCTHYDSGRAPASVTTAAARSGSAPTHPRALARVRDLPLPPRHVRHEAREAVHDLRPRQHGRVKARVAHPLIELAVPLLRRHQRRHVARAHVLREGVHEALREGRWESGVGEVEGRWEGSGVGVGRGGHRDRSMVEVDIDRERDGARQREKRERRERERRSDTAGRGHIT